MPAAHARTRTVKKHRHQPTSILRKTTVAALQPVANVVQPVVDVGAAIIQPVANAGVAVAQPVVNAAVAVAQPVANVASTAAAAVVAPVAAVVDQNESKPSHGFWTWRRVFILVLLFVVGIVIYTLTQDKKPSATADGAAVGGTAKTGETAKTTKEEEESLARGCALVMTEASCRMERTCNWKQVPAENGGAAVGKCTKHVLCSDITEMEFCAGNEAVEGCAWQNGKCAKPQPMADWAIGLIFVAVVLVLFGMVATAWFLRRSSPKDENKKDAPKDKKDAATKPTKNLQREMFAAMEADMKELKASEAKWKAQAEQYEQPKTGDTALVEGTEDKEG